MSDLYKTLGVTKSASADEIKSAYRKLAKKLHPDVNPGRKDIEQKFKEVTAAYEILSDATKRARYDRGEIDAQGNERGFAGGGNPYGAGAGGGSGWRGRTRGGGDPFGGVNVDDLFEQFMRGSRGSSGGSGFGSSPRGEDIAYNLTVSFLEACLGGKKRVNLPNAKTIDVNIPPGITDGHKLRLRGLGESSFGGKGEAGDAIVTIQIQDHPHFTRKDADIHLEAPISLPEAILGGSITVPTLDGHVTLKVPKHTSTDTILRLKGKGVVKSGKDHGDMFVKLKIALPEAPSPELTEMIEKWAKKNDYNPRKKLG